MKNTIQKNLTKKMAKGWKGCGIKLLLFICACLLLNWYQAHSTPAPLAGEEAPEQGER